MRALPTAWGQHTLLRSYRVKLGVDVSSVRRDEICVQEVGCFMFVAWHQAPVAVEGDADIRVVHIRREGLGVDAGGVNVKVADPLLGAVDPNLPPVKSQDVV